MVVDPNTIMEVAKQEGLPLLSDRVNNALVSLRAQFTDKGSTPTLQDLGTALINAHSGTAVSKGTLSEKIKIICEKLLTIQTKNSGRIHISHTSALATEVKIASSEGGSFVLGDNTQVSGRLGQGVNVPPGARVVATGGSNLQITRDGTVSIQGVGSGYISLGWGPPH